jgi:hypothetical protein
MNRASFCWWVTVWVISGIVVEVVVGAVEVVSREVEVVSREVEVVCRDVVVVELVFPDEQPPTSTPRTRTRTKTRAIRRAFFMLCTSLPAMATARKAFYRSLVSLARFHRQDRAVGIVLKVAMHRVAQLRLQGLEVVRLCEDDLVHVMTPEVKKLTAYCTTEAGIRR